MWGLVGGGGVVQAGPEDKDFAMRVLFTGGSGKAGKHAVPYLVEQGHRVLNFDKVPLGWPGGMTVHWRAIRGCGGGSHSHPMQGTLGRSWASV